MKAMRHFGGCRAFLPALLALLFSASLAHAQGTRKAPANTTQADEKVEWITVTGSHIKQKVVRKASTYDTAQPIHVIDISSGSASGERTTLGILKRQPYIFGR